MGGRLFSCLLALSLPCDLILMGVLVAAVLHSVNQPPRFDPPPWVPLSLSGFGTISAAAQWTSWRSRLTASQMTGPNHGPSLEFMRRTMNLLTGRWSHVSQCPCPCNTWLDSCFQTVLEEESILRSLNQCFPSPLRQRPVLIVFPSPT